MQDKRIHIDDKFTDRAWSEMRQILDKEMPVKTNRKKGFFLWWLSGAAGVIALIISLYFTTGNNAANANDINSLKIQNPIILESGVKTPNTANSEQQKNNEKTKSINTQKIDHQTPSEKINQIEDSINNKKLKNQKKAIILNEESSKHKEHIKTKRPIAGLPKKQETIFSQKSNNFTKNQKAESSNIITNEYLIEKNNLLNVDHLTINKLKYEKTIVPANSFNNKKTGRNTIYTSTKFLPTFNTSGVDFGYLKEINTKNNKISWQTGFGYSYISQPLNYIVVQEYVGAGPNGFPGVITEGFYDLSYSNESSVRAINNNNVYTPFNGSLGSFNRLKLHYLTIPFQLKYSKKRFFATTGVHFSALLLAINNNFQGGLLKSLNAGNTDDSIPFANFSGASITSSPDISNFDFSVNIGIGINLSENVGIQLQYQNGINDVIRNNLDSDKNRLFQLSMQYSWQ